MKKKARLITLTSLVLSSLTFSAGCSGSGMIKGIRMSNTDTLSVYYGNFSYEGINVTIDFENGSYREIPLTEDMISEVEQLKFFKIGKQEIEVVYRSHFTTTMSVDVVLNQFKDSYALLDYECTYDGNPHSVSLNQELPEGARITYPTGNVFTNAGSYEIHGVMSKTGYQSKELTATLTIHQAERDTDGIVFEDSTVVFNGEIRSIEATNVPEGVAVTYEAYDVERPNFPTNKVVNAGQYKIIAHFTDTSPNYAKIPDKEAYLTIQKAKYNVADIEFKDVTRVYDGQKYEAAVTNANLLPTGVSVEYTYYNEAGEKVESNAAAGKYTMVATFKGGDTINYEPIEPLKATLTVSKRVVEIAKLVSFESKSADFKEGVVHSLEIAGTLPETVDVRYENNDQTYAGDYEVKAIFSAKNPNEAVDVSELTAYLTINRVRRSVKVKDDEEQYTKDFSAENISVKDGVVSITGYDETVFRVTSIGFFNISDNNGVDPSDFEDGKTYKYVIDFEYIDELVNSSVILSQETDNFTYHAGA